MKSILACCCVLITLAAANAAAADAFGQSLHLAQAQAPAPPPPPPASPLPPRDMRGPGEAGRMSPDERRQLRRDIQNAGRDIYRPPPPQRRDARPPGRR